MTHQPEDVPPIDDWNRLLDGKVAVVTGGADGIGGGISRLFAQHGAVVEIVDVNQVGAQRCRDDIEAAGGTAQVRAVDVTDHDAVCAMAHDVLADHGAVDVLVNNVGDYRPSVRFAESSPESWDAMYGINLGHVFSMTRVLLGPMMEQHSGSIVNVHSVEGMRGYPVEPVYGAMKAAVAHFTTCLAVEMGRHGIRVNGIGTDITQTPQVDYIARSVGHEDGWESWAPVGRLGWPEDQARVALFLASDMSAFVTGHNIPADGGTKAGGGWFYSPSKHSFVNRPTTL